MKAIDLISVNLLLFLLCGCASVPTATEKNQTLLVGKIVFDGGNYVSNYGIPFNNATTSGIELTLNIKYAHIF